MKKLFGFVLAAAVSLFSGAALAQTCPTFTTGLVLTAGQWQACFNAKQNVLGYTPVNKAGDTMLGRLVTAAPGANTAGLNLTPGTAPGSPVNGDLWVTSGGIYVRAGGATVGPLVGAGSSTFAATSPIAVSFPAGVVTYAFDLTVANSWLATQTLRTILAGTTNTYDIGTSATVAAFRTIYAGTSFVGPVGTFTTSVAIGAGSSITSSGAGGALGAIAFVTPGTGVATALGVNVGSAGAFVTFNGAGGTPSSMVGTNITGTAAGLTAGSVTTNANLTGPITSVGNATSIASQTGTGTTFVMSAAPTITGALTASGTLAVGGCTIGANAFCATGTAAISSTLTSAAHTITSASATALTVGLNGATNPAFTVDSSTGSQAAGFKITGAATGGTVALVATDSGSNTNVTINAKGSGTIGIGSVSTGAVTITPATTLSAALTYGGVTLSNAVTGTGNMVLSASPTFTGTLTASVGAFSSTLTSTAHTITSASASALTVGLNGATNPALQVDASTATSATGLKVKSAAAAGGLALSVITSGTNENLTIDAAGSGTITVGGISTGAITLTRATTLSAALTYGGVALSNSVTGAGSMVLSAGPTFTGTLSGATASFTGTGTFGANGGTNGQITLNGSTSGAQSIKVAAAAGALSALQLPTTNGSNGDVLSTDGSGVLAWAAVGGTGTVTSVTCNGAATVITGSGTCASREQLAADRTYFVRADGNNNCNGMTDAGGSSGNCAFLTLAKSVSVATALDLSIYAVTITNKLATSTAPVVLKGYVGEGPITIIGDETTPSNIAINTTSSNVISASSVRGKWVLKGMKLTSASSGTCLFAEKNSIVDFQNIEFGTCTGSAHIQSQSGAIVTASGNYSVSGAAAYHTYELLGGLIDTNNRTVTITNSPAITYWSYATEGSGYYSFNMTFSTIWSVTISIASPGVLTRTGHNLSANDTVVLSTTGALPTGLTAGTVYYAKTIVDANNFTLSATPGGAVINTSGSQSGTQTANTQIVGTRYYVSINSWIDTLTAAQFPGTIAGVTTTGGIFN